MKREINLLNQKKKDSGNVFDQNNSYQYWHDLILKVAKPNVL